MNLLIQCIMVGVGFFFLILISLCMKRFKAHRLPLIISSSSILISIILYLLHGEFNTTISNTLIIGALLSTGINLIQEFGGKTITILKQWLHITDVK